ncbi:MAG: protein-export membrane protein SecD [Desulfobacteraceae bacterium A6]|nr:MAG: protein-export membrane protein SecD [Desulfobacteraceae bacterium A6]
MKIFSWKLILSVAVIIAAIIYVLPTIKPGVWPHKKINLGLDLQGGMHLVLEVETEKAVESTIERISNDLKGILRSGHISFTGIERTEKTKISVVLQGQENIDGFEKILDKQFRELRILSRTKENDLLKIIMDLPEKETDTIKKLAAAQALETIRNRIDQFGVSEPDIRMQGEKRILIQLPGITETQRAKELIGKTALLEFKLLDETSDPETALSEGAPPGSEILYENREDAQTKRVIKRPYLVKKGTLLTGSYLTDASVQIDSQYNEPYVSIDFDKKGARIFENITEENVKKRLAIVLDNKVYSAPVIQEKISGGQARITGSFTTEEARDLAIVLRAGALPAPVTILEERTVGPSLGTDSINKGLLSMWVGGLFVIIFMMIYYKWSGVVADIALLFNIIIIAATLAAFQATLTLPGIAGIILTIGMAVDANVLVYERIREELAIGKTPRAALDAGYERATITVLDSNITTLIAGLVLFQFGTGPVKGFAVTLSIGIISSVFTALVMTRIIFDYFLYYRKIKKLSI